MMNNSSYPKLLAFLAATFLLSGCSGDDVLTAQNGTGTTVDPITGTVTSTLSLGNGSGASYTAGALEIKNPQVLADGSTDVTVYIVDSNNNLDKGSNTVNFESHCSIQGLASFTSTSVTTSTGIATTTYLDQGCQVSDTVIATANWDASISASGDITIDSSTPATGNTLRIGKGTLTTFIEGAVDITTPNIPSSGSTVVSVNLVDTNGDLLTSSNIVTFTSDCEQQGKANFNNAVVTTSTGTATTTYNASGCVSTDTVTASVLVGSTTKQATGFITVASASAGTIQFTSASNSLIALKGTGSTTGLSETSSVTFTIMDSNGSPVANEAVTFSLNSTIGGITLSYFSSTSSANGEVTTTLQSGTVATSVKIIAVVDNNTALVTTSDAIAIATGPADQNSMSLSASAFNPRAWNVDGSTVTITARLADRYNNPIQDGTAVLFTTELGAIESTCTTIDGACSVDWISQDPRGSFANAGRTTILAHVEGEESFVDVNSNGIFDTGDTFTDLDEAYVDENENGSYDAGEPFVDFNGNQTWDVADSQYNGSGCLGNCSPTNSITVRDSLVLVMAEDTPAIFALGINGSTNNLCSDYASCQTYRFSRPLFNTNEVYNVRVTLGGMQNQQALPIGTFIKFIADNGNILGGGEATVPNTTSYGTFDVSIGPDDNFYWDNTGGLSVEINIGQGGDTYNLPIANIDDSGNASLQLGTGSGITFTASQLEIKNPQVETGASTNVSVFIVDVNDNLSSLSNTVSFVSHCSLQGLATFSVSSVNTITGIATTTYTDNGCQVTDTIIATADWDGSLNATGEITIVQPAIAVRIGSGTGAGFIEGEASIALLNIGANASTTVSVNLVDSLAALITSPYTVTFSSACEQAGTANFSSPSVSTNTGTAITTYNATGCSGTDTITATITVNSTDQVATGIVNVAAASAGSIQFSSVSNSLIALQGTGSTTGLPENSTITFTILDGGGTPVAGEAVSFSLNSTIGGITLSQTAAISDSSGVVTTTLQSGSVATSVRVSAVVDSNTTLATTSDTIAIATGPADQNSMSLSASSFNPRAWNIDGKHVSITARLADRFNNPIQDGTAVLFTTELGAIGATCTTVDGACSVDWISQDPRGDLANAGRTTIIAHVEGEESFVDVNANGVFDTGDTFTDLDEAYLDENENGSYDSGEPFVDFNGNGSWDVGDTQYNGSGCATNCSATNSVTVRDSLVLVMAEDTPAILSMGSNGSINDLCSDYASCQVYRSSNPTLNTATVSSVNVVFGGIQNEQTLPLGTTVNFKTTNGKITSGSNHTVPNTTSIAQSFTVTIAADTAPSNDGTITAEIVIGESGGTFNFFIANISDISTTTVLQLGNGSGAGFVAGELEIKTPQVETGASTNVSAFIVDENNNLSTASNDITFTSHCSLQGLATFSTANVNTITGIATTTYTDAGCQISDTLIATADWDPSLTASGDITIVPPAVAVRIGNGTGAGFVESVMHVNTPNIAENGNTIVSVDLVDALGAWITTSQTVTFSSVCEQAGTANFSNTSVITSTGTASTTYNAAGCAVSDTLTATVTIDGADKTATGTVTITPGAPNSIQFLSASNSEIALQNTGSATGLSENSIITFTVLDSNGTAVANESVTLSLSTAIGGITLSQTNVISDNSGNVSTTLWSGTVATSVSVLAVVDSNNTLTSSSTAIAISTGPADQNSMSLSATTVNPRAWGVDGVIVGITARLADRYNNPIQDGTAVLFTTELGAIESTCTTVDGACSVNWTSQSPRGVDGRTTILAYVEGEESFVDFNANGVYDDGIDSFTDLAEAYSDENENGNYDAGEFFVNFDNSVADGPLGTGWNNADGTYNGSSCASGCSATNSVTVRDSIVLVMAEDDPTILAMGTNGSTNNLCATLADCLTYRFTGTPTLNTESVSNILVTFGGLLNEQTLPSGTDISFTATNGVINGGAQASIGFTTSTSTLYVSLGGDGTPSNDGTLNASVTIGDGGTAHELFIANINDTVTATGTTVRLGTGTGAGFIEGDLTIVSTSLIAGDLLNNFTDITVNIVDGNGDPLLTSNTINFTSTCVESGLSNFDTGAVVTSTGSATVTYTATTCSGTDVITVTSGAATASGSINIAPPDAGSIQSSAPAPSLIALQGTGSTTGLPESSGITFTVTDILGGATVGATVNFSLDSTVGGISLATASGITNANGEVTATVLSGTVATSVRVTAVVASDPTLLTTSNAIVIATGPPDQDSISLSASELNPRAWNYDGTSVTITARLADRYNNKIQDGTAILFTTELGSIESSCTTTDGSCFVTWTSQSPRGTSGLGSNVGRTTILATVEGEESFIDINGDGVFSDGDGATIAGVDDLGEAYQDNNENGVYDLGEHFIDFGGIPGTRDGASGTYNGSGCTHSTLCDPTTNSITVRDSLVLVMSEDTPTVVAIGINGYNTNGIDAAQCDVDAAIGCICVDGCDGVDSLGVSPAGVGTTYPSGYNLTTTVNSATYTIAGYENQQVLPVGSSISFNAANGTITGGASHTVTSTNSNPVNGTGITKYTVYFSPDDTPSADGVLNLDVNVEGSTYSFPPVLITD